ncbi:Unannotated [Lentimonas sp. CC4]|nr:Unannotated [Lentimonas sp. CC4]CAA6685060.1 Unannotated [Lentimonas sp. CC6]CAA7074100.1 Unannotated [Lentimonas sp. CC4]CAA7171729.1 Unannotated [Lentimonas sp. CC21]CAA7181933.1 Unannotated [Lentimonas sp. CC8]
MSTNLSDSDANEFFSEVKEILQRARGQAVKTINSVMVEAYWSIGERIVKEEQGGAAKATYGKRVIEALSKSLTSEFGKGFSLANLRNMRQFYLSCPEKGIRYTLSSELSWSHNCLVMREEDEAARHYYLVESKKQNWSVRELERQIKTQSYYQHRNQSLLSRPSFLQLLAQVLRDIGSKNNQAHPPGHRPNGHVCAHV